MTGRQTDRQADRQTDTETDAETDTPTDTQTGTLTRAREKPPHKLLLLLLSFDVDPEPGNQVWSRVQGFWGLSCRDWAGRGLEVAEGKATSPALLNPFRSC